MKKLQKKKNNSGAEFFPDRSEDRTYLCIIGLGNPGYEGTRHNVGFWLVDELARLLNLSMKKRLFSPYLYASTPRVVQPSGVPVQPEGLAVQPEGLHDRKAYSQLILVKPLTYMNNSKAVIPYLMRYYGESIRFVIVADNMDIPPGTARLKKTGGTAGHNGLRSITDLLGKNFWPLYIGIGHPGGSEDVLSYVLGEPKRKDQDLIETGIQFWATQVLRLFSEDIAPVIQSINSFQNNVTV